MADKSPVQSQLDAFAAERQAAALKRQKLTSPATVPPAAAAPDPVQPQGLRGQMPVAAGSVIPTDHLTADELATALKLPGWQPGDPLPGNMPEILAELEAERAGNSARATLETAKLPEQGVSTVQMANIEDLSPEHQASLRQLLDDVKKREASFASGNPTSASSAMPAEKIRDIQLDVEDDRNQKDPELKEKKPASVADDSRLLACPHCNWDLSILDIPDPEKDERLSYLTAILGNIPYEKTYSLFDGNLTLRFRELSQREVDYVYQAATQSVAAEFGQVATMMARQETIMRLRMSMQLTKFIKSTGEVAKLPNSLAEWIGDTDAVDGVLSLMDHVFSNVLKTEAITRVVFSACERFNRLIEKLEAAADRENFWKATPDSD